MTTFKQDERGQVLIPIKAIPGSSRDEVAGMLGERVKVRIGAPAEGGKANSAIVALLAARLGVKKGSIELIRGHTSLEKTVAVSGIEPEQIGRRLGLAP